MNKKQKKMLVRIILAAILLILLSLGLADLIAGAVASLPALDARQRTAENIVKLILYLIPYFIIGYDILLKALKGNRNRQVFYEIFLMAVATV